MSNRTVDPPVWLAAWLAYLHARYQAAIARAADGDATLVARLAADAEARYFDEAIADAEARLPIWRPAAPLRRLLIRL